MKIETTKKEARILAKYYGNLVQKENDTVRSESEKKFYRDALSYCRMVILKK